MGRGGSVVRAQDWRPMGLGSNRTGAISIRNFGNSVYPTLPVAFGGDTKAVDPFYLVSMPGEVKYPTHV